jgi:hypothetical protein
VDGETMESICNLDLQSIWSKSGVQRIKIPTVCYDRASATHDRNTELSPHCTTLALLIVDGLTLYISFLSKGHWGAHESIIHSSSGRQLSSEVVEPGYLSCWLMKHINFPHCDIRREEMEELGAAPGFDGRGWHLPK